MHQQHELRRQLDRRQAGNERQRDAGDHQQDRRRGVEPLRDHGDDHEPTASRSSRVWMVAVMWIFAVIPGRAEGANRNPGLASILACVSGFRVRELRSRPGMTGAESELNRIGRHVHGQRDDRGGEEERQHAVGDDRAANPPVGDRHVGHLERHADHEREIDEIPIVRLARRRETSGRWRARRRRRNRRRSAARRWCG